MRIVILLCLVASNWLMADGPEKKPFAKMTGNELQRYCQITTDPEAMRNNANRALVCLAYMEGFLDGNAVTGSVPPNSQLFCLPSEGTVEVGQAWKVVMKWLDAHPQSLHESARFVMSVALMQTFPCPASTPSK